MRKRSLMTVATAVLMVATAAPAFALPLDPKADPVTGPQFWLGNAREYEVSPGPEFGRADRVYPHVLADGYGTNTPRGQLAWACKATDQDGSGGDGTLASLPGGGDKFSTCALSPQMVNFTIGSVAAPSDSPGGVLGVDWNYSGSNRKIIYRWSDGADCTSAPEDKLVSIGYDARTFALDVPRNKIGKFLCITQGFKVIEERNPSIGSSVFSAYHLRAPWTSYKIVGMTNSAVPTGVSAVAGAGGTAKVTWAYPDSALAGTRFLVNAWPGGVVCEVTGLRECVAKNLIVGRNYQFRLSASRNGFTSPISELSNTITAAAAATDPAKVSGVKALTPSISYRGDSLKVLDDVYFAAKVLGTLNAAGGETVTSRAITVCVAPGINRPCSQTVNAVRVLNNIDVDFTAVSVPRVAEGKYLCVSQTLTTTLASTKSSNRCAYVSRLDEVPPADRDAIQQRIDEGRGQAIEVLPEAQRDPALVQEAVQEAQNQQADAGAPAADANASAAPGAAADAPAAVDATAVGPLAVAAKVNVNVAPIVNTEGSGANGAQSLTLTVPDVQKKNTKIPLKASVSPKAAGKVTFTLARQTPKGAWVVGKVKTATVGGKGKASSKWVLETKKPAGAYTVVASFVPAKKGAAGVTVTKAITVQ